MFAKGPQEGYRAAKDEALALDPNLKCKAMKLGDQLLGYRVHRADGTLLPWNSDMTHRYGDGSSSRDAWASALDFLQNGRN